MRRLHETLLAVTACLSGGVYAATCEYAVVDEWGSGFKAEIAIEAGDAPLENWSLTWAFDAGTTFDNGWHATFDCMQGQCTATPPPWQATVASGTTYRLGFIGRKSGGSTSSLSSPVAGDACSSAPAAPRAAWLLDASRSTVDYVSVKQTHVAEIASFVAAPDAPPALTGSISTAGDAVLAIDLNDVATGIDIRDGRLLDFLFETEFLPTAWFRAGVDVAALDAMAPGETRVESLVGELSLHGVRQSLSADVLITRVSEAEISVSSLKPVVVDSKQFDMASGIEMLRGIANLSAIGEAVPAYLDLTFIATESAAALVSPPAAPADPSGLMANFDAVQAEANLAWQDNSDNETQFLVRRRPVGGRWATVDESFADAMSFVDALPATGEFEYKVTALNAGFPSLPSNVVDVVVTEANALARGRHLFETQCAACHGSNGEGVGDFPALDTERAVAAMTDYIEAFMPVGNASACDRTCAEDVATFVQTLWVTEPQCDYDWTPVGYGARQLKLLTRAQYQRSVEDLLGVDFAAADGLSADTKVGLFANNTHASVSASAYGNALLVAEQIAEWADGRGYAPALSCAAFDSSCAAQLVDEFAPRVFRRPLASAERASYLALADGTETVGDVRAGLKLAITSLLASPQFLYRHELGEPNLANPDIDPDAFELTSYEMATFLAYTFTGSTPDDALLAAAARDELRSDAGIAAHAARLAGGAQAVLAEFVGSWLGTADLESAAKDVDVWPGFDALVPDMKAELEDTFAHVMLDPVERFASLYGADYTFVTEALAAHYGLAGASGPGTHRVETTTRGGILANGAFMARWGEAVETSPILRSVRVRRRMLCQDQPPPPAGTFAAREQKLAELSDLLQDPTTTNRLKYHRLTEDVPCSSCHAQYINPLGFGMEDFDTVGRVRDTDLNGNAIDATGTLYAPLRYSDIESSEMFSGTRALGAVLGGLESAQACLPKQMFRFVTGVGHAEIDADNPEGAGLSAEERSGYACAIDELTDALMADSPRAMFERFGSLDAVRYRKAWAR